MAKKAFIMSSDKNTKGYVVKISESAFIDMCLCALEAYTINQDDKKTDPVETYALVWGNESSMVDGRILYTVQKVSVDTSTVRKNDSCEPQQDSLALKNDFIASFFPDLEFLGDFHTHPYTNNYKEVINKALYEFSRDDITHVEKSGHFDTFGYRVGLVMALAFVKNGIQGIKAKRINNDYSVIEIQFSNYCVWLQAYVAYEKNDNIKLTKRKVLIEVPSVNGLDCIYAPIGHYDPDQGTHIIEGYNDDFEYRDEDSINDDLFNKMFAQLCKNIHKSLESEDKKLIRFSERYFSEHFDIDSSEGTICYTINYIEDESLILNVDIVFLKDVEEKCFYFNVCGNRYNIPQKKCEDIISKYCPKGDKYSYYLEGRKIFVYSIIYELTTDKNKIIVPSMIGEDYNLLSTCVNKVQNILERKV